MSRNNDHQPAVWYGRDHPRARDWGGRLPMALVFPGPSRIGLSTLGWQVVHSLLFPNPILAVERFFWEGGDQPPQAHDTGRPLSDFPVIAYSLNFEEEFKGMAQTLLAAGIPLERQSRPDWPLVLVGGPLAFLNPAPAAPMADLFFVGEAEAGLEELLAVCHDYVARGASKDEFLESVKDMPGAYVPGRSGLPVAKTLSMEAERTLPVPGSSCFVSPESEFRDMFLLEINRGCPYGCRFCAAGYIYRPPRHADVAVLKDAVRRADPVKVGLVGTALTDWPDLMPFLRWLKERGTKFSLSSLRADGLTDELLEFLRRSGARSVTLSLEGASRRLRRAVNKHLSEDDFLAAVERTARFQFNHLKIYLIVGWPGETREDYDELAEFMARTAEAARRGQGKRKTGIGHVTVSASCLIPKPWTPFQWSPMASEDQLARSAAWVKKAVKGLPGFRSRVEKPLGARVQALLSRGDEEVFSLIRLAAEEDLSWKKALKKWPGDPGRYLDRERGEDEAFAWECLDVGVKRDYLYREWLRYKDEKASPSCREQGCEACDRCGMGTWLRHAQQENQPQEKPPRGVQPPEAGKAEPPSSLMEQADMTRSVSSEPQDGQGGAGDSEPDTSSS